MLLFGYGVGSIIGPTLGGLLSYPCSTPHFRSTCPPFLQTHPFFLPFALTAGIHAGLAVSLLGLREPSAVRRRKEGGLERDAYEKVEGGGGGGGLPPLAVGSGMGTGDKDLLQLMIGDGERGIPATAAAEGSPLEVGGGGGVSDSQTSLWTFSWHVWAVVLLYGFLMVVHTYAGTKRGGWGGNFVFVSFH